MIILNVNVNQIILQDSTSWTTHKVERHAGKDGNLLLYNCKNYQVRSYFYKFIVKQRKEGVPRSESYHVRIESGERMEKRTSNAIFPYLVCRWEYSEHKKSRIHMSIMLCLLNECVKKTNFWCQIEPHSHETSNCVMNYLQRLHNTYYESRSFWLHALLS